jgi:hypothetical protein
MSIHSWQRRIRFNLLLFIGFSCVSSIANAGIYDYLPVKGDWHITSGDVQFKIYHILHEASGLSTQLSDSAATCETETCTFKIQIPVSTFNTRNSERESHMREQLHLEKFPYLVVSGKLKKAGSEFTGPVNIEMAGRNISTEVTQIKTERTWSEMKTTAKFEIKASPFFDKLPTLLGMAIEDRITVSFKLNWKKK